MNTTAARPSPSRHERKSSGGPRSRQHLNRLAHHALTVPPALRSSQSSIAAGEQLRMADLFAGIGGFHLAFRRIGARCVFACENNPTARRTYEANFRADTPELFDEGNFAGDVTAIEVDDVPDHDVLTAGFPCQPFSIAGRRRGFDDGRGMHFFEIARIIKAKQPAAYFLENVRGLVGHDGGQTFATIRTVLTEDLGYSFHAKIVRACDHGLPQLRPRLFMVGFRNPKTRFEFPPPVPLTTTLSDVLGGECERTVSRTLMATRHDTPYGDRHNWAHYLVDRRIHRLTPRQGLALQGFPDGFHLPESYNAAMRLIGNSVAVPAVAATAREIARSLGHLVLDQSGPSGTEVRP